MRVLHYLSPEEERNTAKRFPETYQLMVDSQKSRNRMDTILENLSALTSAMEVA